MSNKSIWKSSSVHWYQLIHFPVRPRAVGRSQWMHLLRPFREILTKSTLTICWGTHLFQSFAVVLFCLFRFSKIFFISSRRANLWLYSVFKDCDSEGLSNVCVLKCAKYLLYSNFRVIFDSMCTLLRFDLGWSC